MTTAPAIMATIRIRVARFTDDLTGEETMEKETIQTNMIGRKVWRKDLTEPEECIVVGAWLQSVIEGRNYPYSDGYRVTRVYFLLEHPDGSLYECKAKDTKTHCTVEVK